MDIKNLVEGIKDLVEWIMDLQADAIVLLEPLGADPVYDDKGKLKPLTTKNIILLFFISSLMAVAFFVVFCFFWEIFGFSTRFIYRRTNSKVFTLSVVLCFFGAILGFFTRFIYRIVVKNKRSKSGKK